MSNCQNILNQFSSYLALAIAYIKLNWFSHIEYRAAFYIEAAGMFFNNVLWLIFWVYFFKAFPAVPDWTKNDIITLWALSSAGWGLAFVLFGNCRLLASAIAKGELDCWMLYPRHLLSHFILGKMQASAFGDLVFGFIVYVWFVKPDLIHFLLFVTLTVSIAILFTAFSIILGSLSFFLGNAENLATSAEIAMITFTLYPSPLFQGKIRIFLYTVIPALFVSYFPIEALRTLSLTQAFYTMAGALVLLLIAIIIFHIGLRRYESGNLTIMRG